MNDGDTTHGFSWDTSRVKAAPKDESALEKYRRLNKGRSKAKHKTKRNAGPAALGEHNPKLPPGPVFKGKPDTVLGAPRANEKWTGGDPSGWEWI